MSRETKEGCVVILEGAVRRVLEQRDRIGSIMLDERTRLRRSSSFSKGDYSKAEDRNRACTGMVEAKSRAEPIHALIEKSMDPPYGRMIVSF